MHTDSGMTGISLSGYMPYMTVASLEMSDEPNIILYLPIPMRREIRSSILILMGIACGLITKVLMYCTSMVSCIIKTEAITPEK